MRVLVTGVKGQLGYDVVNELEKRGIEAVGVDGLAMQCDAVDGMVRVKVIGDVAYDSQVAMYDVHGRLIDVKKIVDNRAELGSNCSSGVYVIVLTDGDRQMTEKIIVR